MRLSGGLSILLATDRFLDLRRGTGVVIGEFFYGVPGLKALVDDLGRYMAALEHRTTKFNTWVNDHYGWLYFFGGHVPPSKQAKLDHDTVNVALNSL